ncbi:MAG: hypothetical protein M3P06_12360 [Acidobacteriota bacterium]|nr:hypothetical protein [Acidobacteriota bacterium]
MRTIITISLALFASVSAATTFAQPKAAPIEVSIKQVNDRRTNGSFASLTISLELPKISSRDVEASRVLIAAATDDSGRSLLDPEASEPQLDPNFRGSLTGRDDKVPPPATVSVTLENPDRKAKTVKEVRGEIELYMPGKDPNSVAEIAKFMSSSGKPLAHKALKANGVEISLVSPAQLTAERKRLSDAKRKEYIEAGWAPGEDLDSMVKSYSESLLTVEESDVLARIKDPNARIQDIAYIDAAGEIKRISTRTDEGFTYLTTWGEKPQADWKLKVSMKTPKNLVRYSFVLKDVALP